MPPCVLVTGASGFIARHALLELANAGCRVVATSHSPPGPSVAESLTTPSGVSTSQPRTDRPGPLTWRADDLLQPGRAAALVAEVRPTHLIHAAWDATPGQFWETPKNLDWLRSGRELFEAFAACGGRRAVGVGSCAEYDFGRLRANGLRVQELSTPLGGSSLYARCKRELHEHARASFDRGGASLAWARVFFVYGPGEHPDRLVAGLIRALLSGRVAECRAPALIRDYMDARDAGRALAATLLSGVDGPVNIASGEGISLGDLSRQIAEVCDRPDLLRLGSSVPPDQPLRLVADVSRLHGEAGFQPRYPLLAGLGDAVAWWRRPTRAPLENA